MMVIPAYAQISDKTGLNSRMYVDAGGQEFEILTTANFDVTDTNFDLQNKTLTLNIVSGIQDNLGEIIVPKSLLWEGSTPIYTLEPFPIFQSGNLGTIIVAARLLMKSLRFISHPSLINRPY